MLKLITSSGTGGRRVSSKNCDFSKNWEKIGEIAVFAKINYDKCYMRLKGAQQKLGFLQFLRFVEKIAKYKE